MEGEQDAWAGGASQWVEGSPPAPGTNRGCCLLWEASSQGEMGPSGMGMRAAGGPPDPLLSLQPLEGGTSMAPPSLFSPSPVSEEDRCACVRMRGDTEGTLRT